MRARRLVPILAVASTLAFAFGAPAQDNKPPLDRGGVSRYAELNGKSVGGPAPTRSLSGMWTGPSEAEPNKEFPSLTPLGQELMSANKPAGTFSVSGTNDPWFTTCDPLGFPRSVVDQTRGIAFGEMPGKVLILDQYNRIWREVWMDGRALPKSVGPGGPDPRWFGYSVGHWENDHTLVVQTTGTDARSWVDKLGHPHSVNAIIEERYTRPDHDNLKVAISIDDPTIYTKPFLLGTNEFKWIPDQEFEEQICVPSEGIEYQKIIGVPAGDGASEK